MADEERHSFVVTMLQAGNQYVLSTDKMYPQQFVADMTVFLL